GHDGFGAYEFGGVSDYIDLNSNEVVLEDDKTWTFTTWYKARSFNVAKYHGLYGNTLGTGEYERLQVTSSNVYIEDEDNSGGGTGYSWAHSSGTDTWNFLAVVCDGSNSNNLELFIDGVSKGTITMANSKQTIRRIGSRGQTNDHMWNGTIDDVLIFNRSLSAAEIEKIYQNGLSSLAEEETSKHERWSCSITVDDTYTNSINNLFSNDLVLNQEPEHDISPYIGAHNDITDDLVAEWRFEYGNSTWTYDELERNNGTVSGATHTYAGRVGQGYEFDGYQDKVQKTGMQAIATPITLSCWFNSKEDGTSRSLGICNYDEAHSIQIIGGLIRWYWYTGTWRYSYVPSSGWSTNTWHHVVGTIDSSNVSGLYLDGVLIDSDGSGGLAVSSGDALTVGCSSETCGNSRWFNGTIDEVILWNRTLSAREIGELYNSSRGAYEVYTTDDLGCSLNESNDADDDSVKGIINWYKDNESLTVLNMPFESLNSRHHDINNSDMVGAWYFESNANDRTAHGNDGTLSGDTYLTDGKVGQGYYFDGVNDYFNVSDGPSLDLEGAMTMSVWLKTQDLETYRDIVMKYNTTSPYFGYGFGVDNTGLIRFFTGNVGTTDWRTSNTAVDDGEWHHVAMTLTSGGAYNFYLDGKNDGSGSKALPKSNQEPLYIGTSNNLGNDFNGTLDELIIWNRSLSAAEVEALYKEGLDSEEHAKDYSGHENYGSVVNATYNETGGIDGFGAYEFDGKSGYIRIPDDSSLEDFPAMAVSFWAKYPEPTTNYPMFFDKSGSYYSHVQGPTYGADKGEIFVRFRGSSSYDLDGGSVPSYDEWHHFAITYSPTYSALYIDGVMDANKTGGPTIPNSANDLMIGAYTSAAPTNIFNGSIDEFIIFNRSLSVQEVIKLYQNGLSSISFNETAEHESWKCSITPNDGYEDGRTLNSSDMELTNTPPTTPPIRSPENNSFHTLNSVNISCLGSTDNDGDSITYYFYGGTSPTSMTTLTSTAEGYYVWSTTDGTTYYWTCAAYDGEDYSVNATTWQFDENFDPTQLNPHIGGHNKDESSNVVLDMRFEWSNSTHAFDDSIYGNNGTCSGATCPVKTDEGYIGQGYEFDGVDDYFSVADDPTLRMTSNQVTLSAWAKAPEWGISGSWRALVDKQDYGIYPFGDGTERVRFQIITDGGTRIADVSNVAANTWIHFVGTWNGSEICVYADGNLSACNSYPGETILTRTFTVDIGEYASNYFNGSIDEILIMNRSLSADEIADLYNSSKGDYSYDENDLGCGASEFYDTDDHN
ncbi:LamG domain-containing protein, partial [Nanoarchaeota archaeon]